MTSAHTDVLAAGAPARRVIVAFASLAAASAAVALAASRWPLAAAWLRRRRLAAAAAAPSSSSAPGAPALAELLRRVAADLRAGGVGACEEAVAAFEARFAARGAAEAAGAPPEQAAVRRAQRAEATLAAARAAAEELVRASTRRHALALELDVDALGAAYAASGDAAVLEAGRALAAAHPLHAAPALLRELKAEVLRRELEAQAEARRDWLAASAHVVAGGGDDEAGDAGALLSPEQRRLAQQLALGARAGAPPPPLASRPFAAYLSRRMTAAGATVLGDGLAPCFTVDVLRQHGLLDRARLLGVMIEHAHEEEARRVPQAARRTHAVQHFALLRSHRDKLAQLGLHGVLEAGLLAHEGEAST
jgi:hypothetical protein